MSSTYIAGDVLFEDVGSRGVMILNRPNALNALNSSMVSKMLPKLRQWEFEKSLVIVKSGCCKAFCAGGDVQEITLSSKHKTSIGLELLRQIYEMVYLIGTYRIPYVALIDGLTMGGGVGISVHGKYCICTEKTVFAMPETRIGHTPDVGATYFLSRLKHNLGFYLGLCGTRLKGYELVQAGVATHFCPSLKIPELEKALLSSDNPESMFQNFCTQPQNFKFSLEPHLQEIDKIFASDTIEEIIAKLEHSESSFAKETLTTLLKMCPLALKVSLEAMKRGKSQSLAECAISEYRIVCASMNGHNFIEGVRALLIDKDENPNWIPASISGVTPEMVEEYFNYPPYKGELKFVLRAGACEFPNFSPKL